MRLFIAIAIPEAERRRIHRAARPLREAELPVRWVHPDAYHLTLRFLGAVPSSRLPAIEEAMTRVAAGQAPFALELEGLGGAPDLERPRVLWVEVVASAVLERLHAALERVLAELGFEPEPRPFRPHLTLGRARSRGRRPPRMALAEQRARLELRASLAVGSIDLMQSDLSASGPGSPGPGPRYTCLWRAPLAGSDPP